jgi:hypothetical protein
LRPRAGIRSRLEETGAPRRPVLILALRFRFRRPRAPLVHGVALSRSHRPAPQQRSYVEQRVGQLGGIFQIDRSKVSERGEARALPAQDGMVGLVAVARRRAAERDRLQRLVGRQPGVHGSAAAPRTTASTSTLSAYARRLWAAHGRSGTLRRRVANAITELLKTRVVVVGVDPYTLEPADGADRLHRGREPLDVAMAMAMSVGRPVVYEKPRCAMCRELMACWFARGIAAVSSYSP